jgi:hypothetical protein
MVEWELLHGVLVMASEEKRKIIIDAERNQR